MAALGFLAAAARTRIVPTGRRGSTRRIPDHLAIDVVPAPVDASERRSLVLRERDAAGDAASDELDGA